MIPTHSSIRLRKGWGTLGLLLGHLDARAFRELSVDEMDDAVFDIAFEDSGRSIGCLRYPRSQKRDLGHPFVGVGANGTNTANPANSALLLTRCPADLLPHRLPAIVHCFVGEAVGFFVAAAQSVADLEALEFVGAALGLFPQGLQHGAGDLVAAFHLVDHKL